MLGSEGKKGDHMTKKQVYTLPAQHWLTVHWLKQTELVQCIVQEYVLDLPEMSLCPG